MIPLLFALSCLSVDGPKLLAKHLASAIAAFTQVAPDTELGFAPVPGAVRVIRPLELQSMASRVGVAIAPPAEGICLEWTLAPLDSSRVAEAMQKVLPEGARLEVTEVSKVAVPAGELDFPLKGLNAGFWRGQLKYGPAGRMDVWARVRVGIKRTRVLTVTPLKSGEAIRAEQLRVDEFEGEPDSEFVSSIEDITGRLPKRAFPAGSPIPMRMLQEPAAVQKGEVVRLRAIVGAAQLTLQAEAQASGKVGDFIAVKNPSSGRIVRARVESAGEVSLTR